jgi:protein-L-isoaspartate(D-aspartate) O-methyltransferase
MVDTVAAARRWFAEDLRYKAHVGSRAVVEAFATVPRERFVGPGPWRFSGMDGFWTTENQDPGSVYHDLLIAIDESLHINNGQPSLYAYLFDRLGIAPGESVLHLGYGTGYYTAILATLVGPTGKVTAFEIHEGLAEKAQAALKPWPWVIVRGKDAASISFEPADVIVVSAGASHPQPAWLGALKPGGRLLFPMTGTDGTGWMLLVTRQFENGFAAHFLGRAGFMDLSGARDAGISQRLADAFRREEWEIGVKSLRRDPHTENESCWLHGEGWCLTCCDPHGAEPGSS